MASSSHILKDTVTPFLRRLRSDQEDNARNQAVGIDARILFQRHIRTLDRSRHRAPISIHFYEGAANNTSYRITGDSVEIVVAWQGFAQRYHGGDITPKTKRALTIPTRHAIAIGKTRAGDYEDDELFIVRNGFGQGQGFLARRNGKGRIQVMFLLRSFVHQDPDPTVIPDADAIGKTVTRALNRFFDRYNQGVRHG